MKKDDKYIKSIYYDIRKEHEYKKVMIFTNNIEKIVLHEKGFFFGNDYTVLVPYNEYGKFLIGVSPQYVSKVLKGHQNQLKASWMACFLVCLKKYHN